MSHPRIRVLLLNPPAPTPVFRDAYCSGPAKGPMAVVPLDLLVQSAFLAEESTRARVDLEFVDAIIARLTAEETLAQIKRFAPDAILSLAGAYSRASDAAFLGRLKEEMPGVKLFLSGDLARFEPDTVWKVFPSVDGILRNFTSPHLRDYLVGAAPGSELQLRSSEPVSEPHGTATTFDLPVPWTGLVLKHDYLLPFFSDPRTYSILSSFGCPFPCRYCNANLLGFRQRGIDSFINELKFASSLGFRSLYVRDATFLLNRTRTMELFDAWEATGLKFEWMCFTRPELLEPDVTRRAAALGCKLVMVGVESTDRGWLKDMGRNADLDRVKEVFGRLRAAKIRACAQVMVGTDDESGQADRAYERRLMDFLRHLDPDFISLNVFNRRPGLDVQHPRLAQVEANVERYVALARRLNRSFYFHPRTLVRQLSFIRPTQQLTLAMRIAYHLARP